MVDDVEPVALVNLKAEAEWIGSEIEARIQKVLNGTKFILGPEVEELERRLAEFVGVKHCIGVASGTDALMIALRALGVGCGDEVITTPFSWISTGEVILAVGAKPVFVDIDPNTYLIDAESIAAAISDRTRAIIPVSLFGSVPEMAAINRIAEARGIAVIEDGAQSFGARTKEGKPSCGSSLIGCTSFFPTKPLGCYGDGGAIFTDDDALSLKMKGLRIHGRNLVTGLHDMVGSTSRLDTLQAAILLAKLPHLQVFLERRQKVAQRYFDLLGSHPGIILPHKGSGLQSHIYSVFTIRLASMSAREVAARKLKETKIGFAIYYPRCIHQQPVFASAAASGGYELPQLAHAEKASEQVISLPMHPFLSESEQDRVVDALMSVLDNQW